MTSVGSRKKGCPALGLVLWLAVSAGAHIGDRVYPVAWLSDEMLEKIDLKDGSVDEWYISPSPVPLMGRSWMKRSPGICRESSPGRSCPPTGTAVAGWPEKTRPSA